MCLQNQQLGYYANEEEAARVYDHWVIRTRPSHAETNFPRPTNGGEAPVPMLPTKAFTHRPARNVAASAPFAHTLSF